MRKIGSVSSQAEAQRFSAYLTSIQIPAQADAARDGSWEIWVHNDAQLETATAELNTFSDDPGNVRYIQGARTAEKLRENEKAELAKSRNRVIDARSQWGIFHNAGLGYLTLLLIGLCCGLFALQKMTPDKGVEDLLFFTSVEAAQAGDLLQPYRHLQLWRLFTPALLHGSILHLLFNMMWLRQLGSSIENIEGSTYLAVQVLVFGIASNVAQFYFGSPWFLGMSGVVYGLFGYIWICARHDPRRAYRLDKDTVVWMIIWFFLCFTGVLGPIANYAHAAGLIAGVLWGTIVARQIPFTRIRF